MSIQSEYARLQTEATAQIQARVPQQLRERMIKSLRPAISVHATPIKDKEIAIGGSKLGGNPDLPPDFIWPVESEKPLGFLGQINLQDVAPFDVEKLLPQTGTLAFFYRFIAEKRHNNDTGRVIWFDNAELHRKSLPTATLIPDCMTIPCCQLAFETEYTTIEFHHSELNGIWDYNEYIDVFRPAFGRTKNVHRMLGYPVVVQDPIFITAEMERTKLEYRSNQEVINAETDNWQLLLQIDSQPDNWLLGDMGTMFFVMRKEDLAARRFDKTQFYFEGC